MTHVAPAATSAGTLSAAGDALHRLPPRLARPWICVEPISVAASTTPGQARANSMCSPITAQGVAAPITNPPDSTRIPVSSAMRFRSTIRSGTNAAGAHLHSRSVPPASAIALPPDASSAATAEATVVGAM